MSIWMEMAASIAGLLWRAVRLICECRGRCFAEARGYVLGRYAKYLVSANDWDVF